MSQMEYGGFLTADPKMQRVLQVAKNVASSKAAIIIYGESGTGKELLARFIHNHSPRASRRLLTLNCSSVPEAQLETMLFGMEPSAFAPGIESRPGIFETARESTLLLEDIDVLPMHLQAKLLRAIQEGEVERVGGKQNIKVNVRLIVASKVSLSELVKMGRFRQDLFYRLNVIPLEIPALRNRLKDIDLLTKHFVTVSCLMNSKPQMNISEETLKKLRLWTWPGNVRELENLIERVVLLTNTSVILPEHLSDPFPKAEQSENQLKAGMTIHEAERQLIMATLDYTNQNRTKAAKLLGISIRTLRNKLNEYREVNAI
ncbi:MAG: sigma 54-interacting transcriptional regulator [Bdellovibrionales bacterium]